MFKSLRARLLTVALGFLTLAWLATLIAGYLLTQSTLNSQLDSELQRMANALLLQPHVLHRQTLIIERDKDFEFQVFQDDKMIAYSENAPKESLYNGEGFSQGDADQKHWRVFSTHSQNSRIAVGQDLKIRSRLVHGMILSSLWPMGVALPLIALIFWLSVNFALTPLKVLAQEIQSRTPKVLSPILLKDVPTEMAPVVNSINELLSALNAALEREKHFTDDAAHELRTPLAGIKAQTEALMGVVDSKEFEPSLRAIKSGVDRASRTVSQLLTLARLDPNDPVLKFERVNLSSIVEQVIAQFGPRALAKKVDLGLISSSPNTILGDSASLEILITNLIDNALKYAPTQSSIDVSVVATSDGVHLSIEDAGPGIDPSDRERAFQRFVRLNGSSANEGSGIGLAIVRRIADLHQATVHLSEGRNRVGLRVDINFPATDSSS